MRACRRRPPPHPVLCPDAPSSSLPISSFLANRAFLLLFLLSLCPFFFFTQIITPSFSAAMTPEDCLQIRRAVELPSGLVAADIVSIVEKNRQPAFGDAPLSVQAAMSGEVGPPFVIGGAPPVGGHHQYWPAIIFDGSKYMVVWEENRDGSQYWGIYAAQIFVSGTVRTPAGIPIATEPGYQRYPAVAAGPSYMFLVTYQGIVPCGTYGTYLIWGSIWTGTPTALAFSSASAGGKGDCVTLTWQMGIDVPASSFVIQRAG